MAKYAGESFAKRQARIGMYNRCRHMWKATGYKHSGWAIIMAGPDAAEVGALRYLMKWPAERVLFVDTHREGLAKAEKMWPGVVTLYGDIRQAISALNGDKVSFAHFDFMGYFSATVEETMELVRPRLVQQGIVTYTFFRGREQEWTRNWDWCEAVAKACVDVSLSKDESRFFGYSLLVQKLLGGKSLELSTPKSAAMAIKAAQMPSIPLVYMSRYSATSPMGVLSVQKIPPSLQIPKWERALKANNCGRAEIKEGDAKKEIKAMALSMHGKGISAQVIGAILNLNKMTIAAWKAHETRGSYA